MHNIIIQYSIVFYHLHILFCKTSTLITTFLLTFYGISENSREINFPTKSSANNSRSHESHGSFEYIPSISYSIWIICCLINKWKKNKLTINYHTAFLCSTYVGKAYFLKVENLIIFHDIFAYKNVLFLNKINIFHDFFSEFTICLKFSIISFFALFPIKFNENKIMLQD
jgi:hypothetical protein